MLLCSALCASHLHLYVHTLKIWHYCASSSPVHPTSLLWSRTKLLLWCILNKSWTSPVENLHPLSCRFSRLRVKLKNIGTTTTWERSMRQPVKSCGWLLAAMHPSLQCCTKVCFGQSSKRTRNLGCKDACFGTSEPAGCEKLGWLLGLRRQYALDRPSLPFYNL